MGWLDDFNGTPFVSISDAEKRAASARQRRFAKAERDHRSTWSEEDLEAEEKRLQSEALALLLTKQARKEREAAHEAGCPSLPVGTERPPNATD